MSKGDPVRSCGLCSELTQEGMSNLPAMYRSLAEGGRTLLLATELIAVVPSIGALDESHVLIAPRRHARSFAMLSDGECEDAELSRRSISQWNLERKRCATLYFEHGSGTHVDLSGSCVEHAHLHAIADGSNLADRMASALQLVRVDERVKLSELVDVARGYIYVASSDGRQWMRTATGIPSQWFRREYTEAMRDARTWNWRVDPRLTTVREVLRYFDGLHV